MQSLFSNFENLIQSRKTFESNIQLRYLSDSFRSDSPVHESLSSRFSFGVREDLSILYNSSFALSTIHFVNRLQARESVGHNSIVGSDLGEPHY